MDAYVKNVHVIPMVNIQYNFLEFSPYTLHRNWTGH